MRTALLRCVALRAAAAATAPLLYAPIDREVCVPTVTDDGTGPSFCVDFVREDLFDAAERFCDDNNVCSGHEAGALAYAARRELERQGNEAERALRGRFLELVSEKEDPWTTVSDPIAKRRTRIRRHQARVLVQGSFPEPEEGCPNQRERALRACALSRAYTVIDVPPNLNETRVWLLNTSVVNVGPKAWALIGEVFTEDEHYAHAIACFLRSLEQGLAIRDPGRAALLDMNLGTVLGCWGELALAARLLGRAHARALKLAEANQSYDYAALALAARVNAAVLVPPVVPPPHELNDLRNLLRSDLRALASQDLRKSAARHIQGDDSSYDEAIVRRVGRTLFNLAHQCGQDDAEIMFLLASTLTRAAPSLVEEVPELPRLQNEVVKLGFASAHLCDHSIGKMLADPLIFLARDPRLEVYALHVAFGPPSDDDHVRKFLHELLGERSYALSVDVREARKEVISFNLDVLVFPDLGMEIPSYLLAFSRLARVQCAWWGHPVSTGLPSIDYWLGLDTERDDAFQEYSEQLVRFSHVNTAPFHPQRGTPVNRTDLVSKDPGGAIYLVLGRLFKVHALFDDMLLDLLERDRTGVVLLVGEPQEPLTIKTYQRIQRRGLERNLKTDRIHFIDYWAYMGALATARVVLDTHPYGGCLTALDALSNGVPLVVLPGPAERGRHAASIYQQMGVSDFVAANQSDYVSIAARLGTDDAYHEAAVARIRASYLDAHRAGAVAAEWAGAFLRMARGAV
ncbi:unnamed protein product [Pelagomonas calceolata]|uniref:O-GlcNAc transferase C-terminal domain-containing protein n=2 Tax=Pelagomonas calceolata TaxID=35677 RepID=A0A8J2T266_9STRA|nr:unnamed protein product [Pelagomonas calceolata]